MVNYRLYYCHGHYVFTVAKIDKATEKSAEEFLKMLKKLTGGQHCVSHFSNSELLLL